MPLRPTMTPDGHIKLTRKRCGQVAWTCEISMGEAIRMEKRLRKLVNAHYKRQRMQDRKAAAK